MIDNLKALTDGIVNRTVKSSDLFIAYPQIHGELLKLSSEDFEPSHRTEFLLARGEFERLMKPNKHQSITGSMVISAAARLRSVLDHYVAPSHAAACDSTTAQCSPAKRPSQMIRVLLLSANPIDAPLKIDAEFRAIDAKIRASELRDDIQLIPHGAVRLEDVPGLLCAISRILCTSVATETRPVSS